MKKKIQYTTISALFAFAICATAEDLTLKTNDGILPTEFEWSDTSVWSPDGSSLDNANLAIGGTAEAAVNSTITGGLNLGDINITVGNGGNSANVFKATFVDNTLNFNNINISNSGYSQNVTLVSEGAKLVGNSVNIISDGTNAQNITLDPGGYTITLSGGINVTNNKVRDSFAIQGQTNISGAVTMKAANGAEGARVAFYMWNMTIGGISDGGVTAKHFISFNWAGTLTLNNAADYSWSGDIGIYSEDDNINISKNGVGAQKFVVKSLTNHFNKIAVNQGLFEIDTSAITGQFANNLTLAGGSFKNTGDINVKSLVLTNGEIVLGNDSGTIIVTENAEIGDSKIYLNFKELTQSGEYTILEVGGGLINFDADNALSNFELSNLEEGALAELAWNDNSLVLSYTVPEPAAVAALLGIAALGFALIRRRK